MGLISSVDLGSIKARYEVKFPFEFELVEALNAFELKSSGQIGPKKKISMEWQEKLVDIPEVSSSSKKGQEIAFKVVLVFFKSNNVK
ncbi:hypothetical protein ACLOJK_008831 [Asimina triloba]